MTTAATVVGHFPLILATGPGAGARNSIGIMLGGSRGFCRRQPAGPAAA